MPQKSLEVSGPEPKKSVWPDHLTEHLPSPPRAEKTLSYTCASTSGSWSLLTPPQIQQVEMIVHFRLVPFRLLAGTNTWQERWDKILPPCVRTRGSLQQKYQNPRQRKYSNKNQFAVLRWWLSGAERNNQCAASYTCHTQKQSTEAKVTIPQQEELSNPLTQEQGHTCALLSDHMWAAKEEREEVCFWLFALHCLTKNTQKRRGKLKKKTQTTKTYLEKQHIKSIWN